MPPLKSMFNLRLLFGFQPSIRLQAILFALNLLPSAHVYHIVKADSPAPIVISPSDSWDGNDGPWSTFSFRVGSQLQAVRLLPDFYSSGFTIVEPFGCPDNFPYTNCSGRRGNLFDYTLSTTWKHSNLSADSQDAAQLATNHISQKHTPWNGTDTIIAQIVPSSILVDQPVSLTKSIEPFIGLVGLSGGNISTQSPGFLESAVRSSKVAARAWSYTAGSANARAPGSLIIGGYDLSRMADNTSTFFKMTPQAPRPLALYLGSITAAINSNTSISKELQRSTLPLSPEALIVIDSITAFLWLPEEACVFIERAFGLTWDGKTQLYLIPETLHQSLLQRNPVVTFGLVDPLAFNSTKNRGEPPYNFLYNISYSSLNLNASYPLLQGNSSSRYFPLKRGANPVTGAFTLGRAFLQETYLTVDYDNQDFRLTRARYDKNAGTQITSMSGIPTTSDPRNDNPINPKRSSPYLVIVVLIVVTTVVVSLGLCLTVYTVWAFRRARWPFRNRKIGNKSPRTTEGDETLHRKPELEGSSVEKGIVHMTSQEIFEADSTFVVGEVEGSLCGKSEVLGDVPLYELDIRPHSSLMALRKESG